MQSTPTKLWTPQYVLVISLTFLFFLCVQMLTAGFPAFVTELNSNPAEGGLMTTAFMFASILTRPVIGIFIHKLNMKLMLGITLFLLAGFILLSYGQTNVSYLVVVRVLHGIGFGIASTLLATFTTNLIPQERLGEGIGYFGMATSLGTTLGPMLAVSFIHSFSFNITIVLTASIAVLGFLMSLYIRKGEQNQQVMAPAKGKHSFLSYAFDKRALLPCLLVFLFYVTFSGIVNFINGLGQEIHLGGKVSLFFLVNAIVSVVLRPFSGKIYDRMGHMYLIYPACFMGIGGLILLSITQNLPVLILSAAIYGLAYGVMQPTLQAWAVSRVSADKKATANAMSLSFMDLAMALGAVSLGSVAGQFNYSVMYGGSSLLVLLLFFLYLTAHTKKIRRDRKEQLAA